LKICVNLFQITQTGFFEILKTCHIKHLLILKIDNKIWTNTFRFPKEFFAVDSKTKTRTVSFRIPEDTISDIEKEARIKLVSTNVLINQILSKYVTWDKYEHKMRMFAVPEEILHKVIEGLDDTHRREIVEMVYHSIRDWALLSQKKFDIHSCLQVLEDYCRIVGISVDENISSGIRSFVIRHNLGRNLSLFIGELAEKIFLDLVKIRVDSQITNSTIVITLRSKLD